MPCFSGYFLTMLFPLLRAGGNSWSSGKAPPPPPGASSKDPRTIERSSKNGKGGGKSGLSGLAIAGIILGILLALAILIALFSKRSSPPPSHFYDEERLGNQKSFTPMVSQELSNDKHRTSYSGNHICSYVFFRRASSDLSKV